MQQITTGRALIIPLAIPILGAHTFTMFLLLFWYAIILLLPQQFFFDLLEQEGTDLGFWFLNALFWIRIQMHNPINTVW